MLKRVYSLEEAVEKVMLDSDSNSEPEIDEAKVEKQLQKEHKKKISKKCPEKSISSRFGRDAGLSVPRYGREVEHHVLVEVLAHHVLDLEEEQQASNPNHLTIMRTGIN